MKFTLDWLKEHLETDASIGAVADAMTMAGLGDTYRHPDSVADDLAGVERRGQIGHHRGETGLLAAQGDHHIGELAVGQPARVDGEEPVQRSSKGGDRRRTRRGRGRPSGGGRRTPSGRTIESICHEHQFVL